MKSHDSQKQYQSQEPFFCDAPLRYEPPTLIALSTFAQSLGQCTDGSGAVDAECMNGSSAASCMFGFMGAVQP